MVNLKVLTTLLAASYFLTNFIYLDIDTFIMVYSKLRFTDNDIHTLMVQYLKTVSGFKNHYHQVSSLFFVFKEKKLGNKTVQQKLKYPIVERNCHY